MIALPKKIQLMLELDDEVSLLKSLPKDFDPQVHKLNKESLSIKAAQLGAMKCLNALLETYHSHKKELLYGQDFLGQSAYLHALEHAKLDWIKKIDQEFPDLKTKEDEDGIYPFMYALMAGHWEEARYLAENLPQDAFLSRLLDGTTILHLMLEPHKNCPHPESWTAPKANEIEWWIKSGVDPMQKNGFGYPVVFRALESPNHELNAILMDWIKKRPELHEIWFQPSKAEGFPLLHSAVWHGNEQWLEHGLKICPELINKLTEKKYSLMHMAVFKNQKKCAQKLMNLGFDVNNIEQKWAPISHSAILSEDPEYWLSMFKEFGVNLNQTNNDGVQSVELAMEHLSLNSVEIFFGNLEKIEKEYQPIEHQKFSLLDRAILSDIESQEKLKKLLEWMPPIQFGEKEGVQKEWINKAPSNMVQRFHTQKLGNVFYSVEGMRGGLKKKSVEIVKWEEPLKIKGFIDDLDEEFGDSSLENVVAHSLLLAVEKECVEAVEILLEYHQKFAPLSEDDKHAIWRVAFKKNIKAKLLRLLEDHIPLNKNSEFLRGLSLCYLGPSKRAQLKGRGVSLIEEVEKKIEKLEVFEKNINPWNWRRGNQEYLLSKLSRGEKLERLNEWTFDLAASSKSQQHLYTLPEDGECTGFGLWRIITQEEQGGQGKDLGVWIGKNFEKYIKKANEESPWGKWYKEHKNENPIHWNHALSLIREQAIWDLERVFEAKRKKGVVVQREIKDKAIENWIQPKELNEVWLGSFKDGRGCLPGFMMDVIGDYKGSELKEWIIKMMDRVPLFSMKHSEEIQNWRKWVGLWLEKENVKKELSFLEIEDKLEILEKVGEPFIFDALYEVLEIPESLLSKEDRKLENPFSKIVKRYANLAAPSFLRSLNECSQKHFKENPYEVLIAFMSATKRNTNRTVTFGDRWEKIIKSCDWKRLTLETISWDQNPVIHALVREESWDLGIDILKQIKNDYEFDEFELDCFSMMESEVLLIEAAKTRTSIGMLTNNQELTEKQKITQIIKKEISEFKVREKKESSKKFEEKISDLVSVNITWTSDFRVISEVLKDIKPHRIQLKEKSWPEDLIRLWRKKLNQDGQLNSKDEYSFPSGGGLIVGMLERAERDFGRSPNEDNNEREAWLKEHWTWIKSWLNQEVLKNNEVCGVMIDCLPERWKALCEKIEFEENLRDFNKKLPMESLGSKRRL